MYKMIKESNMPYFLRVILNILLTITCVYWIGFMIYKILDGIRIVLNFISQKNVWWAFIISCIVVSIGGILLCQYVFDIDVLGKINEVFQNMIQSIVSKIKELSLGSL